MDVIRFMYDDYLYPDRRRFHWMTRNRVTLDSPEAQAIINAEKDRLRICLFVKKSDGESSDFYYLGDLTPVAWKQLTIDDDQGNTLPVVTFDFALSDPVDDNLYAYLTTWFSRKVYTAIGRSPHQMGYPRYNVSYASKSVMSLTKEGRFLFLSSSFATTVNALYVFG